MNKIPVYFMPGLAASSKIFERIKLPEDKFEKYFLEWFLPEVNETLESYVSKLAKKIKHENCVLIGVSFGGIIVQELKKLVNPKKVIIISSVKNRDELPLKLKFTSSTKLYKLLPTGLICKMHFLEKYFSPKSLIGKRLKLYNLYLSNNEKTYLDWAIENVLIWNRTETDAEIIHIHGNEDAVFPIQYVKDPIIVPKGTHIMIIDKYKWFNENLPAIISE
jgi:pimeloyl-ACP methyl ester carboxylesterase